MIRVRVGMDKETKDNDWAAKKAKAFGMQKLTKEQKIEKFANKDHKKGKAARDDMVLHAAHWGDYAPVGYATS